VQRFADKDRHQIFVEPEGWKTHEVYVNGFSTSLPLEVQQKAIKHIPGFENAVLFRPGYAIEYDFFPPTQLNLSLETKNIQNLFFAGQINGTTGYEEAAAQGLMAGINAHRKNTSQEALVLTREQAYIGVLIDDLITKGTDEPYRMFTSRAEYRITLRQDSADIRLTPIAHELGLVSDERMDRLKEKEKQKTSLLRAVKKSSITPTEANDYLIDQSSKPISQSVKIESLLLRPNVKLEDLIPLSREFSKTNASGHYQEEVIEATEVLIKYAGYIKREREMAQKMLNLDKVKIPTPFNFEIHQSISTESREKLQQHQPVNLGQASRIPGVKPVDISVLMIALEKHVSHET
jgi:tRNA uridine 5-carboxymethylaminomethyl modification enzyme